MVCPKVVLPHAPILAYIQYCHTQYTRFKLTSETVKNTSGLSSVMILLTESSWQRSTRTFVCRGVYTTSRPLTDCSMTSPTSDMRTCPSLATLALEAAGKQIVDR